MSPIIVGIDPGRNGAAVAMAEGELLLHGALTSATSTGRPLSARWPTPFEAGHDVRRRAVRTLCACVRDIQPGRHIVAVVEQPAINYHGRNQQGMATLLEECGWWVGTLQAWGWEVRRAPVGRWLPDVARPCGGDTKARALAAACARWPGVDWTASSRARKPHDGIVDAALLALWGTLTAPGMPVWSVERDGGRGARVVYEGIAPRARWTYEAECAGAKRGTVRLLCNGAEVSHWGVP